MKRSRLSHLWFLWSRVSSVEEFWAEIRKFDTVDFWRQNKEHEWFPTKKTVIHKIRCVTRYKSWGRIWNPNEWRHSAHKWRLRCPRKGRCIHDIPAPCKMGEVYWGFWGGWKAYSCMANEIKKSPLCFCSHTNRKASSQGSWMLRQKLHSVLMFNDISTLYITLTQLDQGDSEAFEEKELWKDSHELWHSNYWLLVPFSCWFIFLAEKDGGNGANKRSINPANKGENPGWLGKHRKMVAGSHSDFPAKKSNDEIFFLFCMSFNVMPMVLFAVFSSIYLPTSSCSMAPSCIHLPTRGEK